jgi:hypothetical protein
MRPSSPVRPVFCSPPRGLDSPLYLGLCSLLPAALRRPILHVSESFWDFFGMTDLRVPPRRSVGDAPERGLVSPSGRSTEDLLQHRKYPELGPLQSTALDRSSFESTEVMESISQGPTEARDSWPPARSRLRPHPLGTGESLHERVSLLRQSLPQPRILCPHDGGKGPTVLARHPRARPGVVFHGGKLDRHCQRRRGSQMRAAKARPRA